LLVVWLAHEATIPVPDATVGEYNKTTLNVHKHIVPLLTCTHVDAVLRLAQQVTVVALDAAGRETQSKAATNDAIAKSGKDVYAFCTPHASRATKNRFGMPEKIKIPLGTQEGREGWAAIRDYIPKPVLKAYIPF
jgi:hypothetical protein